MSKREIVMGPGPNGFLLALNYLSAIHWSGFWFLAIGLTANLAQAMIQQPSTFCMFSSPI